LTGECTTQLALRANSGSVCVDFELGHQLQYCYRSFAVPEICEVPALWQKATSSRLICSVAFCRILAQVLLALPQFVIVGSGRRLCAPTQPSSKGYSRQHRDGGGDGGKGGTPVAASDVRTHSFLTPHFLHVAVGLYPCDS